MKKILSICSLIGAISLGALSANAQPMANDPKAERGHSEHEHKFDAAARATHLQKSLQLSDEQTTKVKKVFEDSEQKDKAIVNQYQPQFDAFHAEMKKLHEQTHTQLNGILTPKQQEALKAQHAARGHMLRHGGKRRFDDNQKHDHDHDDNVPAKNSVPAK